MGLWVLIDGVIGLFEPKKERWFFNATPLNFKDAQI